MQNYNSIQNKLILSLSKEPLHFSKIIKQNSKYIYKYMSFWTFHKNIKKHSCF